MDPFPEEAELRELFGSDPVLLDRSLPWRLNVLSFESSAGADRVECVIEPVYHTLTLRWLRDGHELVFLDLTRVRGLAVDRYRGRVSLLALFEEQAALRSMRLQLSPAVHVTWGTRDDEVEPADAERRELPLG
jgi:hypothetical protein